MKTLILSTLVAISISFASVAGAEPDDATKERARSLGLEGLSSYDAGDYQGALTRFEQAYALYPVPTLALYSARALAKLGRLTQAADRYQQAMSMKLPSDAPEQFRQAQTDATNERAELVQRIPRLRVQVVGADPASTPLTVDGVAVPSSELSAGHPLNPGAHAVSGRSGEQVVSMNVALQERETKTIVLEFKAPEAAAPPPPVTPTPMGPGPAPPPSGAPPQADKGGSGQRTLGWVVLGLGGVGLGVGAVTGLMATSKKSDLETHCVGDLSHCPPSVASDVDQYNNLRTVSTIGFIAGGVGVAGGLILVLTAPSSSAPQHTGSVTPWVGVGSAGVRGWF
jgi:hypothetical protein